MHYRSIFFISRSSLVGQWGLLEASRAPNWVRGFTEGRLVLLHSIAQRRRCRPRLWPFATDWGFTLHLLLLRISDQCSKWELLSLSQLFIQVTNRFIIRLQSLCSFLKLTTQNPHLWLELLNLFSLASLDLLCSTQLVVLFTQSSF